MTTALRIATVNCLHGLDVRSGAPGPVDPDLTALAGAIASLDADVVALQEVDRGLERSGRVDQVAVLADALGCVGVFAPALHGDPDRRWTVVEEDDPSAPGYGVGLLSRLPIVATTRLPLPGGGSGERPLSGEPPGAELPKAGWDREPRVALRADLRVDRTTLAVTSTHLSYTPWRGVAQLRAVTAAAARGAPAAVLAGDLNLPARVVRALVTAPLGTRWRSAGGRPTYPLERPRVQLDQVLVCGAVDVDRAAAHAPTTSDHLPLVADLRLLR